MRSGTEADQNLVLPEACMIPPGQKGRDDGCVVRSDRNRAAVARAARRKGPPGVAFVGQDSNFGHSGEHCDQRPPKRILELAG
jgi:hypothetical protein